MVGFLGEVGREANRKSSTQGNMIFSIIRGLSWRRVDGINDSLIQVSTVPKRTSPLSLLVNKSPLSF